MKSIYISKKEVSRKIMAAQWHTIKNFFSKKIASLRGAVFLGAFYMALTVLQCIFCTFSSSCSVEIEFIVAWLV